MAKHHFPASLDAREPLADEAAGRSACSRVRSLMTNQSLELPQNGVHFSREVKSFSFKEGGFRKKKCNARKKNHY